MIAIDFAPGTHGHFLSYVVNQYIFKIDVDVDQLFQQSGAAHTINLHEEFLHKRQALHGHYSSMGHAIPKDIDSLIYIEHDPAYDFVLLTNIYHRCHPLAVKSKDLNVDDIKKLHKDLMYQGDSSLCLLRQNWYTKLWERHFSMTELQPQTPVPIFRFNIGAFYNLAKFVEELQRCANFLQLTLNFDPTLVRLHDHFLAINQGYQKWRQALTILDACLRGQSLAIDPKDWQLQAFLNLQISRLFRLYDGPLFASDIYPSDTKHVYDIIKNFIDTYDDRW